MAAQLGVERKTSRDTGAIVCLKGKQVRGGAETYRVGAEKRSGKQALRKQRLYFLPRVEVFVKQADSVT